MSLVTIPAHDVLPVRSRVSWGAILAGAVVALATYFLLTLLGGAIGLTVGDDVRSDTLGTGAAIWAIAATVIALFVGGWVTARSVVGEDKKEAVIHGIIMWGVVFAMILWLVASGVRSGFGAMVGVANAAGPAAANVNWEDAARQAGVPQERIDQMRSSVAQAPEQAEQAEQAANDPQTKERVRDTAAEVTWWTLAGTLLSIAAAALGALVGSGPSMRVVGAGVPVGDTHRTATPAT